MRTRTIQEKLEGFGQVVATRAAVGFTDGALTAAAAQLIVQMTNATREYHFITKLLVAAAGTTVVGIGEGVFLGIAHATDHFGGNVMRAASVQNADFTFDHFPQMMVTCCKIMIGAISITLLTQDITLFCDMAKDMVLGAFIAAFLLSPGTQQYVTEFMMKAFISDVNSNPRQNRRASAVIEELPDAAPRPTGRGRG